MLSCNLIGCFAYMRLIHIDMRFTHVDMQNKYVNTKLDKGKCKYFHVSY